LLHSLAELQKAGYSYYLQVYRNFFTSTETPTTAVY